MSAVLEPGWTLVRTTPGAISVVIDKPAGVVSGDLLILIAALDNIPNAAPPAGFTEIASRGFNNAKIVVWAKIAGVSEPATYTVSNITSGDVDRESVIFLGRVTGADTSGTAAAAFDIAATDSGQSAVPTCPSVTTTAGDELVLVAYAKDRVYTGADADDTDNPAGTTIVYRRNSGGSSSTGATGGLATFAQATAGATGAKAWADAGNDKWAAATLAIKSAAGGGGATKLAAGSLDAALAKARSIQAAIDAAPARGATRNAQTEAALAAAMSALVNLNGALGRLLVLGAGLDASLTGAGGGLVHAELTAALRRVQAAALNLDGALGVARTQTMALDAATGELFALAVGLSVVLRARLQASAVLDAVIGQAFAPGSARTFPVPGRGGHAVPGDPRTFVIPPGSRRH